MEDDFGDSSSRGGNYAGAYGSAGATGQFQPLTFIKKPQVILRIIGLVFAIVVFGCIFSRGYDIDGCAYGEPGACGYGEFVGLSAFLITAVLLVSDALFDNISNVMHRKYIVIADIMTSAVWSFLYFVCFCYLTDSWRRRPDKQDFWGKSQVEAAIAFSFFSIGIFIALTVLAVMRYRAGVSNDMDHERPDLGYSSDQFGDPRGA